MENLLQHVIDDGAEFATIDITGVPTVDTLTAQPNTALSGNGLAAPRELDASLATGTTNKPEGRK